MNELYKIRHHITEIEKKSSFQFSVQRDESQIKYIEEESNELSQSMSMKEDFQFLRNGEMDDRSFKSLGRKEEISH